MRDERGMTLVELLVAMAMGTIVIFAATAIILSALNVTRQVTGRETAMSQGRTGIETLLGQLNSACLLNSTSPVVWNTSAVSTPASPITPAVASDATHLVFTTGLGDSTNPTPTLHVVQLGNNGSLLDYAYPYTGTSANLGTPTLWTFSSSSSQILNLAQDVTPGSSGAMFSYYAYSPSTYSLLGVPALAVPLTVTTAATVAEVDLDFRFLPYSNSQANQSSELQDSAVFSLTAQDNSSPNGPCQ